MASLAMRMAGATASAGVDVASTAISSASASCFRSMTSGWPHPTECACIGAIFYYLGCHDHKKFNLLLELHEIDRLSKGASVYLVIRSGRWTTTSQVVKEQRSGRVLVEERLLTHVRQADNYVTFFLYKKGVLKSDCIAVMKLSVKEDMIDKHFPKRVWYIMQSAQGSLDPRINLSLYRLDANVPTHQSPLLQQAFLMAQQEADEKGEELKLDLADMSQKDRLLFLSRVLEGPVERISAYGRSLGEVYFKAVEVKSDRWEWCYWPSKEACRSGAEAEGSIPFLAISLVLPDRSDRNMFFLRYHDSVEQHDCFFRRVDRDRNLWSDGIFEFIEKLRNYREMCAATAKVDTVVSSSAKERSGDTKQKKKSKKSKDTKDARGCVSPSRSNRSRSEEPTSQKNISCTRRLQSPRASPTRSPNARASMLEEVMVSTQPSTEKLEDGDIKENDD